MTRLIKQIKVSIKRSRRLKYPSTIDSSASSLKLCKIRRSITEVIGAGAGTDGDRIGAGDETDDNMALDD